MTASLKCIDPSCGKAYGVMEYRTQCECGSLLDVAYDSKPSPRLKEVFRERRGRTGNIFDESGVWRYRELLNFAGVDCEDRDEYGRVFVSLDGEEGKTKPFHLSKVAEYVGMESEGFFLQFEGRNPTGSFKDNGMATGFTHAKMLGVKRVGCASTGNTSASMAAFAANEGWEAVVYVGEGKIAASKLAQAIAYGARVVQVKGGFDDAFARIRQDAAKTGLYLLNSINAFRLEGQKTMVFRALDHLEWEVPDWLVLPGGNLGNASAFGKALAELKHWGFIDRLPRVVVVNAEGAPTFFDLWQKGLRWKNGRVDHGMVREYYAGLDARHAQPGTLASAIAILKPANLHKALRALEDCDGLVVKVGDTPILDAQAVVGRNGFGCEPASAATVAGIKALREQGVMARDDTVVGILTGDLLKDPDAIMAYHSDTRNKFANTPVRGG
jgi:threonine synthase